MLRFLRSFFLLAVVCGLLSPLATSAQMAPATDTQRGIELNQQGKADEAIAILERAVKQNQKDAEAWHFLGLAYVKLDKLKNAQKAFERAIKLRPTFAPSHSSLAYLLLQRKKLGDAATEANRALALEPGNATAHYVLGSVYLRQGKLELARNEADAALKVQPDFGGALLLKCDASVALFEQDTDIPETKPLVPRYHFLKEAAQALETYFRVYPNEPDTKYWRGLQETLHGYLAYPDQLPGGPEPFFETNDVNVRARILYKPTPEYTESARMAGISGTIKIKAVLARDGRIKNLSPLNNLGSGLTEQAINAARRIKFLPAMKNGQPVSQYVVIEYNFHIF